MKRYSGPGIFYSGEGGLLLPSPPPLGIDAIGCYNKKDMKHKDNITSHNKCEVADVMFVNVLYISVSNSKKWLKSVYICRSYRKLETGIRCFWTPCTSRFHTLLCVATCDWSLSAFIAVEKCTEIVIRSPPPPPPVEKRGCAPVGLHSYTSAAGGRGRAYKSHEIP